jgi:hypothetical protein
VTGIDIGEFPICRHQIPAWDREAIAVSGQLTAGGWRQLLVTVAGRASECIAAGVPERASCEKELAEMFDDLKNRTADEVIFEVDVDDSDAAAVFRLLWQLGRDVSIRELRDAEREAHELQTRRWPEIEARAAKLVSRAANAQPHDAEEGTQRR